MGAAPRIVIAGWAGAGNVGDELLTAWAISEVEAAGGVAVALSVDPADTRRRHGVDATRSMSISAVRTIMGADGLVVGPGGILQDQTSLWSLPAHCLRPVLAKIARIPVVGAGLGVGPLVRRSSALMLRSALGGAHKIVVRDPESAELLEAAGLACDVAPDAMFAAAPLLMKANAVEPDRIVVSLRNSPVVSRLRIAKSREIPPDIDAWADALKSLRRHLDVQIRFAVFDPGRDGDLHRRLGDLMGNCEIVEIDQQSALLEMARAVVAVTGRYHAGVLAAALARPIVVVGQGVKLPALAAMVGAGSASISSSINDEELRRSADLAVAGGGCLSETAARLASEAAAHGSAIKLLVDRAR